MTILAIPFFLPGHTIPMLRLCNHLAASTGSRVAVLTIPDPQGNNKAGSEKSRVEIIPCLDMPPFMAFVREKGGFRGLEYLDLFASMLENALSAVSTLDSQISCVISDVYVKFAPELASRLGVPWFALWTSSTAEFVIFSSMPRLINDEVFPFAGPPGDAPIDCIPGLPVLMPTDYPSFGLIPKEYHPLIHLFKDLVHTAVSKSQKLLLNSVYRLEKGAIDHLRELNYWEVIPAGPLNLLTREEPEGNDLTGDDLQVLEWLDQQTASSVLYISLGTTIPVHEQQFRELAFGIEKSGVPFLWSVRKEATSMLPEEFEERNTSQGLVVSWAPQAKVLRHPSVAGFFTHCGWNSVMEAMSAGVPMITRPLMGEQALNRKFVVDVWGVGVALRGGELLNDVVNKDEIARAIRELVESSDLRSKAKILSSVLIKSARENGSLLKSLLF